MDTTCVLAIGQRLDFTTVSAYNKSIGMFKTNTITMKYFIRPKKQLNAFTLHMLQRLHWRTD